MTQVEQAKAWVNILCALGEAIKDLTKTSPLGGVPSGHLYASVMGKLSLDQYNQAIDWLVKEKMVVKHPSHLLEWVGTPPK